MEIVFRLLRDAFEKQNELRKSDIWRSQIPERCPPVLWFGNHQRDNKIATLGANPSRKEFLNVKGKDELMNVSEEDLPYLEGKNQRFYTLRNREQIEEHVLRKIIQSYDDYFSFRRNPYAGWFGRRNGGKVEAFINGLGYSFYESELGSCVHIDLIPFVTRLDFKELMIYLKKDIFSTSWASNFLRKLIDFLNPKFIIVFGETNVEAFNNLFEKYLNNRISLNYSFYDKTKYGSSKYGKIPIIGLSVNLGNPIGFSKSELNEFGKTVKMKYNLNGC